MRRQLLVRIAVFLMLVLPPTLWMNSGVGWTQPASAFPTGKITITMFKSDQAPQFEPEQSLIDEWQKLHPNVTVQAQQAPLGPAFQKLSTRLPSGGGPAKLAGAQSGTGGSFPFGMS